MKTGCPFCAPNGRVLAGFNDLASQHPDICREWDREKNDLTPMGVRPASEKIAWWVCSVGHSYDMPIYQRANGYGCPYCAGRRVLPGFNDLATCRPWLVAEWSSTNTIRPQAVTESSNRSVEWVCSNGHRWKCRVASRTSCQPATTCPRCWKGRVSVIEMVFWDALRDDYGFNVQTGVRTPVRWGRARFSEVDALLRDARIVIEYDGWYWHRSQEKTRLDMTKTRALLADGWTVIRIREQPLESMGLIHDRYYEIAFSGQNYRQADIDSAVLELASLLTRLDG